MKGNESQSQVRKVLMIAIGTANAMYTGKLKALKRNVGK
jgi:hypothetical protein